MKKSILRNLFLSILLAIFSCEAQGQIEGSNIIVYCTFLSYTDYTGPACIAYKAKYLGTSEGMFQTMSVPSGDNWTNASKLNYLPVVDNQDGQWGRVAVFIDKASKQFFIYSDNKKTNLLAKQKYFSYFGMDGLTSFKMYYDQFTGDDTNSHPSCNNCAPPPCKGCNQGEKKTFTVRFYNPSGSGSSITLLGVLITPGATVDFCSSPKAIIETLEEGKYSRTYTFDASYELNYQSFIGDCNNINVKKQGWVTYTSGNGGVFDVN